MKGYHDDLIMAIAMAIYVSQNSFVELERSTNQAKAMLDSWITHESERPEPSRTNQPVWSPHTTSGRPVNMDPNNPKEYLWLFGGLK